MGICLLLSAAAFKEILPVIADWTWEKYFAPHFLKGPFWPLLSHMWPPTRLVVSFLRAPVGTGLVGWGGGSAPIHLENLEWSFSESVVLGCPPHSHLEEALM